MESTSAAPEPTGDDGLPFVDPASDNPWLIGTLTVWCLVALMATADQAVTLGLAAASATSTTLASVSAIRGHRSERASRAALLQATGSRDVVAFTPTSRKVACPDDCGRRTEDANELLTGMTRWLLAVRELTDHVLERMGWDGRYRRDIEDLADDTEALAEYLLHYLHDDERDLASDYEALSLLLEWHASWSRLDEPLAAMADETFHRKWRAATLGARSGRFGRVDSLETAAVA